MAQGKVTKVARFLYTLLTLAVVIILVYLLVKITPSPPREKNKPVPVLNGGALYDKVDGMTADEGGE